MEKIAIRTKKGGVGKTTIALNTACFLSMNNKKVLLVDIDSQYNLTKSLGIKKEKIRNNILELFNNKVLDDLIIEARKNLFLIPADLKLNNSNMFTDRIKELMLKKKLDSFDLSFFDYIIFDCPPSSSILTDNVLCYVEKVWAPLQLEYLSFEGLEQVANEVSDLNQCFSSFNVNIKINSIIPNFFDKRTKLSKEVLEFAKKRYSSIITSPVYKNVRISEAPAFGKSIFEYEKDGKAVQNYIKVIKEIINNR